LSQTFPTYEGIAVESLTTQGRGSLSPARLEEHLHIAVKRLKAFGIRGEDCVASLLPEGPDAMTVRLALAACCHANYCPLDPLVSRQRYESLLLETDAKLLLMHPEEHPAREAACALGIPVANVLRHFEAGVFTLEAASTLPRSGGETPTPAPSWKRFSDPNCARNVPLVLIAPGFAYRRLAIRLDADHPVIGITPPGLDYLPPPHTFQHIAAECVRMLRRYRPHGPYALAGWRAEGLVALEMARLLEEEGEQVAFVAFLDASHLFLPQAVPALTSHVVFIVNRIRRMFAGFRRSQHAPSCEFLDEALRRYHPHPWYGKILHIRSSGASTSFHRDPWFDWRQIAPQGIASYQAQGEILAEQNLQTVAQILASELGQPGKAASSIPKQDPREVQW